MLHLDLEILSRQTGIEIDKLRYCYDNHLVPSRSWLLAEGKVGELSLPVIVDKVLLACAGLLLTVGFSSAHTRMVMHVVTCLKLEKKNPLNLPEVAHATMGSSRAVVQIADGRLIRWIVAGNDTRWVRFSPVRNDEPDYEPLTVVALDIGRIRDVVKGE